MNVFRDYINETRDAHLRNEDARIQEVMQLRQIIALLVKRRGGEEEIPVDDFITLPRETRLTMWTEPHDGGLKIVVE